MNGEGTLTWADGRQYEGGFINDKRHGWGEFKWKDGRQYRGGWDNGKQHGIGFFLKLGQSHEKEGEWNEGKRIRWVDQ